MRSQNARPKWWQLYLAFPLLIALFVLDHRLEISIRGHQAVQIGIILVVYGLIYWWLKANSVTLSRMDQEQYHGRVMVVQIRPSLLPEDKVQKHPMIQLPSSEVKGMLGNTFQMETTDPLPVAEVPQKTNKE